MRPAADVEGESADLFGPDDTADGGQTARLPDGWIATESESRPGEVVYENEFTGERIAWIPTRPASDVEGDSPDLYDMGPQPDDGGGGGGGYDDDDGGYDDGGGLPPLPEGWEAVESQSHPGQVVYENIYTGERISWEPQNPASEVEGESQDLYG